MVAFEANAGRMEPVTWQAASLPAVKTAPEEIRITLTTLVDLPDPPPPAPPAAKPLEHPAHQETMAVSATTDAVVAGGGGGRGDGRGDRAQQHQRRPPEAQAVR
ncbi:hypothetical protein [Streptomyces sp. NBC_01013]|uniref:hypothetical protein n=1 Tax=Streptomyces sp. NBC_01013 TaxID=2903718 RepID=UPI00386FE7C6|nr:hypothetical protein OG538_31920 [Streptomyces sp. NBC_01013]